MDVDRYAVAHILVQSAPHSGAVGNPSSKPQNGIEAFDTNLHRRDVRQTCMGIRSAALQICVDNFANKSYPQLIKVRASI